jgi:hypothetical protein
MYGVEEMEVRRVVAEAGGHVLAAREDHLAGKEWVSVTYCVERI